MTPGTSSEVYGYSKLVTKIHFFYETQMLSTQFSTTGLPFATCHIYFTSHFCKTYLTFPFTDILSPERKI